uniref:CLPTM1 regulator of GABA type A receptor forward trafficking n=2 Tax=Passeriformes TaxID=9126 RepID=A0A8C3XAK2_9PASS
MSRSRCRPRFRRPVWGAQVTAASSGGGSSDSNGAAPGPRGQQQQQPAAPNAWQVIKGVLFRIFIIWAISSWFRRGPSPQEPTSPGGTPRSPSRNLFPKDTLMDLYVYISEHEHFTDFNVSSALFWEKRDLVYGDWTSGENSDGCYEHFGEVDISQSVQRNGSIYVHVYFTKSGFHPDPRQKSLYRRLATVHTSRMINKYKRRRFQKTKNLLTGETEADPEMIKVGIPRFGIFLEILGIFGVVLLLFWGFFYYCFLGDFLGFFFRLFLEFWGGLDRQHKVFGIFPCPSFKDKSTYVESSTKVYDDMAFRYLSWILFPLLGCYAVYSLLYLEHKGWYSWVLSMLYGFLLTFGFITMTPQLFINYKLQSVAHLPWRMLTYKALNTFIDDLFAFVIKMPMMYRIGCLRDGMESS